MSAPISKWNLDAIGHLPSAFASYLSVAIRGLISQFPWRDGIALISSIRTDWVAPTLLLFALVFVTGAAAASSDLVPRSITVTPSTVSPGGSITVRWRVANEGSTAPNAYSVTVVRINQSSSSAAGSNLAQIATPPVAAGSSIDQTATINVPSTPGTYYVWVIVDNYEVVTNQTNVSNDIQRSNAFTVQPAVQYYRLTVNVSGGGVANTSGISPSIHCPTVNCYADYEAGRTVTLNAAPYAGQAFQGWSGSCSGTGQCTVQMNGNRSVTANFGQQQVGTGQLVSPANGATGQSTTQTLSWQSASGANRYYVVVTESQSLLQDIIARNLGTCLENGQNRGCRISGSVAGTSHTPGQFLTYPDERSLELEAGRTYYWSVQPYYNPNSGACNGQCIDGAWAAIRTFSTGVTVGSTSLQSPSEGATNVATNQTFDWTDASGANVYWLLVSESRSTLETIASQSLDTCNNCRISAIVTASQLQAGVDTGRGVNPLLEAGRFYHWTVQPFHDPTPNDNCSNQCTNGPYSGIRSFSTGASSTVRGSVTIIEPPGLGGDTLEWRLQGTAEWRAPRTDGTIYFSNLGVTPESVATEFRRCYGPENTNCVQLTAEITLDDRTRSQATIPSIGVVTNAYWSDTRPIFVFIDGIDEENTFGCLWGNSEQNCYRQTSYLSNSLFNSWGLSNQDAGLSSVTTVSARYDTRNATINQIYWGGAQNNWLQRCNLAGERNDASCAHVDGLSATARVILRQVERARSTARPVVVVGHSWGSVAAYQAILELENSHLLVRHDIAAFITMGSPLGISRPPGNDDLYEFERNAIHATTYCDVVHGGGYFEYTACKLAEFASPTFPPVPINEFQSVAVWNNYFISPDFLFDIAIFRGDAVSAPISDPNVVNFDFNYIARANGCDSTEFFGSVFGTNCHGLYFTDPLASGIIRSDIRSALRASLAAQSIAADGLLSVEGAFRYPPATLRTVQNPTTRPTLRWSSLCQEDQEYVDEDGDRHFTGGYCPRYWLTVARDPAWLPSAPGATSCQVPTAANGWVGCDVSMSFDHATEAGAPGSDAIFTVGTLANNPYGSQRRDLQAGQTYYWRIVAFERSEPGIVSIDGEYSEIGQFTIPASAGDAQSAAALSGDRTLTIIRRGEGRGSVTASSGISSQTCPADRDQCVFAFPAGTAVSLSGSPVQSAFEGFSIDCGTDPNPSNPVPNCGSLYLDRNSVVGAHFRRTQLSAPRLEAPVDGQAEEQSEAILVWSEVEGADHYLVCISPSLSAVQNWNPGVNANWDSCRSVGGVTADVIGMTYDRTHRIGDLQRLRSWQGRSPRSQPLAALGTRYWRVFAVNETDQVTAGSSIGQFDFSEPVRHTLTLAFSGNGSGRVSSAPEHFDCTPAGGPGCSAPVRDGGMIALIAHAASGSSFAGWASGCLEVVENDVCIVEMDAAKTVTAAFSAQPTTYRLTTAVNGSGTVATPSGFTPLIQCNPTCSADYSGSTQVTLWASPSSGWSFAGWSGACSGTGSCTVTMNQDRSVSANFTALVDPRTLTITRSGTGTGTVTSNPAAIDCGATCSASFDPGTIVTLNAVPGANSRLTSLAGCDRGSGSQCTVTISDSHSVEARFDHIQVDLTLRVAGQGSGTVTSNTAGIDCSADCSTGADRGSIVVLTASPSSGSEFGGWGGACAGAAPTCSITMSSAREVWARFNRSDPPTTQIVSSVIPQSRGGAIGSRLTAFAGVVNTGEADATNCRPVLHGDAVIDFSYVAIDRDTPGNPMAPENFPIDIAPNIGSPQQFLVRFSSAVPLGPVESRVIVLCDNATTRFAPPVNTIILTYESTPPADIVATMDTTTRNGTVTILDGSINGAIAAAAINITGRDLGIPATMRVQPNTGFVPLGLSLQVCQTDAAGVCLPTSPLASEVDIVMAGDPVFIKIVVRRMAGVGAPFIPAFVRVYLDFFQVDENGQIDRATGLRGRTSVGVDVSPPAGETGVDGLWYGIARLLDDPDDAPSPVLLAIDDGRAWMFVDDGAETGAAGTAAFPSGGFTLALARGDGAPISAGGVFTPHHQILADSFELRQTNLRFAYVDPRFGIPETPSGSLTAIRFDLADRVYVPDDTMSLSRSTGSGGFVGTYGTCTASLTFEGWTSERLNPASFALSGCALAGSYASIILPLQPFAGDEGILVLIWGSGMSGAWAIRN